MTLMIFKKKTKGEAIYPTSHMGCHHIRSWRRSSLLKNPQQACPIFSSCNTNISCFMHWERKSKRRFLWWWIKASHFLNILVLTLNLGSEKGPTHIILMGQVIRELGFVHQMIQSLRGRRESRPITCWQLKESLKAVWETASSGSRTSSTMECEVCHNHM